MDEINDSPIEQVRLTVPITDDPTLPCLTFRTWFLGIISCALLAFMNQFFSYRQNTLYISSVTAQIVVLPLGNLMAAYLPSKFIRIPGTKWSFSLNPGPFNLKEHVLITICASAGANNVFAVGIVAVVKAFYHREIHPLAAMLLILTCQLLGYGWAGIYRKFLVDSPFMWWPSNLVQVSLFRALHDVEKRPKGGLTRLQFFIVVLISSFAYYVVPNYLFPSITALSFVCWIWKDSVTAQQIGSGLHGLGIGSFALDWSTLAGFLGSPLATPGFAVINILVGYVLFVYIFIPLVYWNNLCEAKRFPLFSSHVFDSNGGLYNVSLILDQKTFEFNQQGYDAYSKIYLSIFFAFSYGLAYATLASTLSHVALFHGRTIWQQTKASFQHKFGDVHTRIMKKNYDIVPQWWFYSLLILVVGLATLTCEGFGRQLQLPFWGILLAMFMAAMLTLPISVIRATTNQQPELISITELVIGYIYPGKPLANITFKIYGTISMHQAILFLGDFKLGHYMKIPPKSMFLVQLVGTLVASMVYFTTAWWLLTSVEYICDLSKLPKGSPWTCPVEDVQYNASVIWGVASPLRVFGSLGIYPIMNYSFLIGILAPLPVWLISRMFPKKKWLKLIIVPIILGGPGVMPPARAVNYVSWLAVGIFFNIFVYRRFKGWWARHNYILSGGLDAGVAFMGILCYLTLQIRDINGMRWWGLALDDHCPLATCPTALAAGILPPQDDEVNDSPIEQVRLTVPITDDPTQPCLTFRTWFLGILSCGILAFLNQFFGYRQNAISLSSVTAQILVLPIGKLMAAYLPERPIKIPRTKWSFSLNPGPFNLKEHVLITIFASAGSYTAAALGIVTIMKAFYIRELHPLAAILLVFSTQMLGFGWAGIFRKFLVDSPYMWWPSNLVQVSLFRALHDVEKRPKKGLTRLQFFIVVLVSSFSYYVVPNYLFPSITALSIVCWIWKDSVTAHQIGSANHGLGVGSFALDWSTVAAFLGSPLATPGFAIINILVGFVSIVYIIIPLAYWNNLFGSKRFPIYSAHVFNANGGPYDVNLVLNQTTFQFNEAAYDNYSKIHLSVFFAFTYGISFAVLAATVSHVALFHGRSIWQQTIASIENKFGDVHTRLMKKNYDVVPQWWFYSLLLVVIGSAMLACEGFNRQLQLPYWGILLAMFLALMFTLPIAVIVATTNQGTGINVISELIIGYLYPGKPLANVTFKIYGTISMSQAILFLADFKLGHYMKVPPKSMFIVQLAATIVASSVQFGTAWWLLNTVEHICDPTKLPEGSPWTCPGDDVFYNASVIWGVVGPLRMFGSRGIYPAMNYFFLFGLLAPIPVWLLSRKYPHKKWIALINAPVIIGGAGGMPPVRAVNYICWLTVGLFFNFVVYRKFKSWWARHNYILSAGLDAGVAFMAILCYFTLQSRDINGPSWWGLELDDHCPLATCPTAPGIVVQGCPVF